MIKQSITGNMQLRTCSFI